MDNRSEKNEEESDESVAETTVASPVNQKARQLALAYHIQSLIESGEAKDIASIADAAGISRARISQILDLALLAPNIQESILDGSFSLGSHALRQLAGILDWEQQKGWLASHE